jgi:hypothetical protein
MAALKECTDRGALSNSQKECVIQLIKNKGKSLKTLQEFWPISLMNVDAKLFSKCIDNRLKDVCEKFLGVELLAYIGKRQMQDGQAAINRALELFRSKKIKCLMACIDSCKYDFIWQTLKRYNLGLNLIHYMQ